MEFLVHPVNKELVPIHFKYFVRNLTLHHFLLIPEVWNIHVSINLSDIIIKTITKAHRVSHHATLRTLEYSRMFLCISSCQRCHHIYANVHGSLSGKSTHICMVSNSVTHLRSYTNSTIADIAGNSEPMSLETPLKR